MVGRQQGSFVLKDFNLTGLGEFMPSWYAFHIYRNSRKYFIAKLESDCQQYFVAEQITRNCYDVTTTPTDAPTTPTDATTEPTNNPESTNNPAPTSTLAKASRHQHVVKKLLFPSLIFVRCELQYVEAIRHNPDSQAAPYLRPGTREAAVISDKEMETFMFVLQNGYEQLEVVDEKLAKGDKVRILEGVLKGAEGYIVRIKGDRRFVVSINGIAAVATSYIPQRFLQKII